MKNSHGIMRKYLSRIKKIKKQLYFLQKEDFKPALDGTNYKVFLSQNYVIRFRDDNPHLLIREAMFLKQANYSLIPKVLWVGRIDKSMAMIENRLPGKTINLIWPSLLKTDQKRIVKQIVEFIKYLRAQRMSYFYSVNTGKKYQSFLSYLNDGVDQKIINIQKYDITKKLLEDLLLIINNPKNRKLFARKAVVTQGDLIIHNLLSDGKKLTGVLDWELAQLGDPDYDLCRLFYYQECAKAYQEKGADETFESDYMDKLISAILDSGLIKNEKKFYEKYNVARAFFYLNALNWAARSRFPKKNIQELIDQWNKKTGQASFIA